MKKAGFNKTSYEKDYVLGLIYEMSHNDSKLERQNRRKKLDKKTRTIDLLIKEGIIGLHNDYEIIDSGAAKHIFKIKNKEYYDEMQSYLQNNPEFISVFKEFIKHYSLGDIDRRHQLSYILFAYFFERQISVNDYTVYEDFSDEIKAKFLKDNYLKIAHPNAVLKQKYIKHPYSLDISRCDYDFDLSKLAPIPRMASSEAIKQAINTLKEQRTRLLRLHRNEPRHMMLIGEENQGIVRLDEQGLMISPNKNKIKKLTIKSNNLHNSI